ncbi:MAG: hypothetical protein ACI3XM_08145, partial [Eubacteriales bacterium]
VRDEDSIDMLEIIYGSMYADIGFIWDITKETQSVVAKNASDGEETIASLLEKRTKLHTNNLKRVMKKLTNES